MVVFRSFAVPAQDVWVRQLETVVSTVTGEGAWTSVPELFLYHAYRAA